MKRKVQYHYLGLECPICRGFNTRQLDGWVIILCSVANLASGHLQCSSDSRCVQQLNQYPASILHLALLLKVLETKLFKHIGGRKN
jgi:hypothetical protein